MVIDKEKQVVAKMGPIGTTKKWALITHRITSKGQYYYNLQELHNSSASKVIIYAIIRLVR